MRRNDFPRLIFQLTPVRTAVTRMQQSSSHRARVLDNATAPNVGQAEPFEQLRPARPFSAKRPPIAFGRHGNFALVLQALRKIDFGLMVTYRFEWVCAAVHRPTPAAFAGSSLFDTFRALIGQP